MFITLNLGWLLGWVFMFGVGCLVDLDGLDDVGCCGGCWLKVGLLVWVGLFCFVLF